MTTSWTSRVHRRAETMRQAVTNCGHSPDPYPKRNEKVKFGAPVEQVCKTDIPAPLLVLILKINKQGPYKKDVFRAPGHQANIKKLTHFLQTGRLVNIEHYSVYTIASVIKKFLRKLPGGIFGEQAEERLFEIIRLDDPEEQRQQIRRVIKDLPTFAQRLLVLLFGTFRVIAMHAENGGTSGMSSEALGVSVAPSFFMSCISGNGKQLAKVEDIQRFKLASKIVSFMIENFALSDMFGRENYEYYARITGRVLRVDDDWIFAFDYPHEKLKLVTMKMAQHKLAHKHSYLQLEALKWGMAMNSECWAGFDDTVASGHADRSPNAELGDRNCPKTMPKIVMSASDHGTNFAQYSTLSPSHHHHAAEQWDGVSLVDGPNHANPTTDAAPVTFAELKDANCHAENTRSLSFLPIVHQRQEARMRTRSEWFLAPVTLRPFYTTATAGSSAYDGASDVDVEDSSWCSVPTSTLGAGGSSGGEERLLVAGSSKRSSLSFGSSTQDSRPGHSLASHERFHVLQSSGASSSSSMLASESDRLHGLTLHSPPTK